MYTIRETMSSSSHDNQFDKMDDYSVELVCEQLFKSKEYTPLCHLTLTDKRFRQICRKYVDKIHGDISVMTFTRFSNHGDENDWKPFEYIKLTKITNFFKKHGKGDNGFFFKICVVIPGKFLDGENNSISIYVGSDDDGDTGNGVWYYEHEGLDNLQSYLKFIGDIRDIYKQILQTPDIY